MTIPGIARLYRGAHWARKRCGPKGLILLYHRVAQLTSDPQLLGITLEHFAEHLEIVAKLGRPMHLQRLAESLQDGKLPNRTVVVTFDDGYADNLYHAKPLLERYDIPATVFVSTGFTGQDREFWWDELDRVFLEPGTLPETLNLKVNGRACQWELGESGRYSEEAYGRNRSWDVLKKDDPSPRQRIYRCLHQLLRPLPEEERRKVLEELLTWAGAGAMGRPTHRTLSPNEVFDLALGELIEVGAHTVTHPVLSALPVPAQRDEIKRSKTHLEEILGHAVVSFSYPYGSRSDYTAETVAFVREAGFACACSNVAGLIWPGTDRFELPRVLVRDWDGENFARRLEAWFRG